MTLFAGVRENGGGWGAWNLRKMWSTDRKMAILQKVKLELIFSDTIAIKNEKAIIQTHKQFLTRTIFKSHGNSLIFDNIITTLVSVFFEYQHILIYEIFE